MSTAASSNSTDAVSVVNGHEVSLKPSTESATLPDASQTDWIIVKFDKFVDYHFKQELRQSNIEVYDHLGDNSYLCKYVPDDVTPVANIQAVSHLALYPEHAVPVADIDGLTTGGVPANNETDSVQTENTAEKVKMPFVLALHPDPKQSPEEVLTMIQSTFGAEHLDDAIAGDTIRVKIDPASIPELSKIDSIRTIANVQERTLFSVRQRAIMQFSKFAISSNYKGNGEIVFIADTGFDMGVTDDVHPAFTGRVLAATTSAGATIPADRDGHGTHVAGSVLANLNQYPGKNMFNAQGTAEEAKLISIALNFANFPTTLSLLTQDVPSYGSPVIMNNSWGNVWTWTQKPYGIDDASIVDQVMYNNPNTCIVFAAGNDGRYVGNNGKQQQIGDFASAKNSITVGASYSDRPLDPAGIAYQPGGEVHSAFEMTGFSSTGPTVEGRLAPDVVAPGTVILSARSRKILPANLQEKLSDYGHPDSDQLLFLAGTSMATPAVTGCVATLRGAFRAQQKTTPTGALLKALLVHGAVDLAGTPFTVISRTSSGSQSSKQYQMTPAPNPFQGYGLVDINNSLAAVIGPITGQRGFVDGALASGLQQKVYAMTIPNYAKCFTVTLAYTDLAGAALQNQITLSVKLANGATLRPLVPTDPLGRDINWQPSNVAKIVAAKPLAGQAEIVLDIQTGEPTAKFAVVWTVA